MVNLQLSYDVDSDDSELWVKVGDRAPQCWINGAIDPIDPGRLTLEPILVA